MIDIDHHYYDYKNTTNTKSLLHKLFSKYSLSK